MCLLLIVFELAAFDVDCVLSGTAIQILTCVLKLVSGDFECVIGREVTLAWG